MLVTVLILLVLLFVEVLLQLVSSNSGNYSSSSGINSQ